MTTTKILTYTGHELDLALPQTMTFSIVDIAIALSRLARWNGHTDTRNFYSVARHSIEVSEIVAPKYRLAALLHDAAEAYIGDISTPVKELLPGVKGLENLILKQIGEEFGFEVPLPEAVLEADAIMQATEWRDLMNHNGREFPGRVMPLKSKIVSVWEPEADAKDFLRKYNELTKL